MLTSISTVYQPSLLDLFRPDEELDSNVIIIGNPETEHNLEQLESFLDEFSKCSIFALDTETFGQDSWQALYFRFNHIRLLQIGLESGQVLVIDFGGWKQEKQWQEIKDKSEVQQVLYILADRCFDRQVAILGVNLKFDGTNLLHHFGIKLRQCRDLMIISQVLWAGLGVEKAGKNENRSERCTLPHGLAGIAQRHGYEVDKTEQTSAWGWTLRNSQINYAIKDVRILFPLFYEQRKLIVQEKLQYTAWVECNGVSAFIDMEYYGVPISIDKCNEIISTLEQEQQQYIGVFESHFPLVSWSSNPQVLESFKTIYPEIESVNKGVLNKLEHPAAKALVKARALNTDINYVKRCVDHCFSGSIRSIYRQIGGGGNGRSSCSADVYVKRKKYPIGTQLQNPSKKIRDIFVAPEGYIFFDFDGAQMHQRIATQCANVELLKKIFLEDFDGHSILAGRIAEFAVQYWKQQVKTETNEEELKNLKILLSVEWNKDLIAAIKGKADWTLELDPLIKVIAIKFRDVAKTVVYSVLNGATAGKLLLAMHQAGYKWFTIEMAKEVMNFFRELYPELDFYIKNAIKTASSYDFDFSHFLNHNGKPIEGRWGLTKTLTGRHVYFKKYPNKFNPNKLEVSYTDCTASQWSGTEKDIMIHWAVEVLWEADKHPEWDFHMCNLPHDQGTFLGKEEYKEEIAPMVVAKFQEVASKWITVIPMVEAHDLENPLSCVKKVLTK